MSGSNFEVNPVPVDSIELRQYGNYYAVSGTPYSGPVVGIDNEYNTDDFATIEPYVIYGFNLTALTPNVFIHTGAGEDAIQVLSGTNVLDGGEGSNFLTNGSGFNTDYVDDRAATSDIWSTLVNFHSGDNATVWGLTPESFMTNWVNNDGAAGSKGLTLHATSDTKPEASLTLTGYTTADLINGKLAVSYGTVDGNDYLNVHAN